MTDLEIELSKTFADDLEYFFELPVAIDTVIPTLKKDEKPDDSIWLEYGLTVYMTYVLAVETKRQKTLHEGFDVEDIFDDIHERAIEYIEFRDFEETCVNLAVNNLFVEVLNEIDVDDIEAIWTNI